ncbi:serine/threonine-protein kinase PLK4 isoform X1 [Folsomia candida]|uniref:serine/threonine-protein kinase PLK4 isoform X1 n=1 Tax=Folsomia candida TaxID=158441 RepID=UPI001604EC38|nr:serine/threonine-protein kinase PLK4 isoform X1 [Folsomia candida]
MKGKKHDNIVEILKATHKPFTMVDIHVLLKIPCLQNNYKILDQFQLIYLRAQRGTKIPSLCIEMELCGRANNETDNPALHRIRNRIVKDMYEGLKYLHRHHIMHRDFRPENIMFSLSRTEEEEFAFPVKVGDFGLCRQIHSAATATKTLTPEVGNAIYRAPEANSLNYGFPADWFSFGLVSWEVLQQIMQKDTRSMFYYLVHDLRTSLVKRAAWWFRDLENVIVSLTKSRPQDRIDPFKSEVIFESVEQLHTFSRSNSSREYYVSEMASSGEPVSILTMTYDKITININVMKSIFDKIGGHNLMYQYNLIQFNTCNLIQGELPSKNVTSFPSGKQHLKPLNLYSALALPLCASTCTSGRIGDMTMKEELICKHFVS